MTPAGDHEGESLPRAEGPRVEWGKDTLLAGLDDGDEVRLLLDRGHTDDPLDAPSLLIGAYEHDEAGLVALDEAGVRALIGSLWSGWQRLTEGDGT